LEVLHSGDWPEDKYITPATKNKAVYQLMFQKFHMPWSRNKNNMPKTKKMIPPILKHFSHPGIKQTTSEFIP